jgi:hypothetical protein
VNDPSRYFKLPSRGITISTATTGGEKVHHYTFFCDARHDCYAVAYGSSEESVRRQLNGHACPSPARRDALASGRTIIEKGWDELDDVIDAIKANPDHPEYLGMEGDLVKGYAQGIAEMLAFLMIPYFRLAEDILKQANRRWKMRTNQLPWEPTPGINFYPAIDVERERTRQAAPPVKRAAAKAQPTKRAVPRTEAAAPPARQFTAEEADFIRASVHGNGIPLEDLAKMYSVSVDRIRSIAGSSADASFVALPLLPFGMP